MSIRVEIHNNRGEWIEMDRACFGFLSFIDQWDSDDIEDHSDSYDKRGYEEDGLEGFESHNLKSVGYIEDMQADYLAELQKAMAGLPQFYGDVEVITKEERHGYQRTTFMLPIEGKLMQPAVLAGMMLRNVICYSSQKNTFTRLIKEGVDHSLAFLLAQAFPYRQNGLDKSKEGFYRNFGGDETIFPGQSRLCDIVAAMKGELGDCWQGTFGDTGNGYGRYGEYNGDPAPKCDRSKTICKDLTSSMMIKKGWEDSPLLNSAKGLGVGHQENDRVFIPTEDMIKVLVPMIMEQLK